MKKRLINSFEIFHHKFSQKDEIKGSVVTMKLTNKLDIQLELETNETAHFKNMIMLRDCRLLIDEDERYAISTMVTFSLVELQRILKYDVEYFNQFKFRESDVVVFKIDAAIKFKHNLNQHVYDIIIKDLEIKLNQYEDSRVRQYIDLILKRDKNIHEISDTIMLYMREEEPIITKYYDIDKLYDEQMKQMINNFNEKNQQTQVISHLLSDA